ncbi:ferric enterobactin receptor [Pedobacter sp. UYP30]|uniref:TonB-dependent receptor domain-containing protein n=1 Tax=Pedobacter sp. UYP30 TaxID=1756400 RepID=UPI003398B898
MKYTLLAIILFVSTVSSAQKIGKITGTVKDSTSKISVDYASIALFKTGSNKPIDGVVTNNKGEFTINNISVGAYKITVGFIGYKRKTIDNIKVDATKKQVNLGNILLASISKSLNSVTVTGKVPIIQNKIDKIVYNAENDLTSQGGVATDVLKKVPQVSVDIDGNVQLLGSSGVKFLINGKPSSIFGSSVADALNSIPANQIKSVEVISSPGAKYDAAGTAGIINIILKKNNAYGINGSVNLSGGTRRNNGSVNLGLKRGSFGMNAYFNGSNRPNTVSLNGVTRNSFFADTTNTLIQNGNTKVKRGGISTGIGFDWDINKKNNINASFGYDSYNSDNNSFNNQTIETFKNSQLLNTENSVLNSNNHSSERAIDLTLAYKKTFNKPDEELNFEANAGWGKSNNFFDQRESLLNSNPFSGLNSNNNGLDNDFEAKVDYTYPVSDKFTLETGAKTIINHITSNALVYSLNNTQQLVPNLSQTNSLNYNRNIYAAYISGTYNLFNYLDVKSGLRYERTLSDANYSQVGIINIHPYNTFAPSIVVAHNFENKNSIKLSYSYRIERPDYEDLNPFLDLSDPRNANQGNPNLKPEIGNNFELGFNRSFKKGGNLNIALFFRHNNQDIKSYATFYPAYTVGDSTYKNLTLNTRLNIGQEIREGISISGSIPFGSKLTVRPNMYIANQTIVNKYTGGPNVNGFRARVNLNTTYEFNKDFSAELFGTYSAPENNIQGKRPAFFFYNFAIRKQLFNKKGSIGFTATNPFNKYINLQNSTTSINSVRASYRQLPFRSFGLTIAYRFGKLNFKKDEENPLPNSVN